MKGNLFLETLSSRLSVFNGEGTFVVSMFVSDGSAYLPRLIIGADIY